jgi:hypothetical protein
MMNFAGAAASLADGKFVAPRVSSIRPSVREDKQQRRRVVALGPADPQHHLLPVSQVAA